MSSRVVSRHGRYFLNSVVYVDTKAAKDGSQGAVAEAIAKANQEGLKLLQAVPDISRIGALGGVTKGLWLFFEER
jgi:hypothetical protein